MDAQQVSSIPKNYQLGLDNSQELILNPTYAGTLRPKELETIRERFAQYKQLEAETQIPWKVLAAFDCAVTDFMHPPKKLAEMISEAAQKTSYVFPADFTATDAADLVRKAKEQTSKSKHKYFDEAYLYFYEIEHAFGKSG